MKTNQRPRKIRIIMQSNQGLSPVYGVVLPPHFKSWLGVNVTVSESGGQIILTSGAQLRPVPKVQLRSITKTLEIIQI